MKDNFWAGFEKRAVAAAALPGVGKVIGAGLKGIGSAFKSRMGQWGSGAQTGWNTIGNIGSDVWGHAKTMGAGLQPHFSSAVNRVKGWFNPSAPATAASAVKPRRRPPRQSGTGTM